MNRSLVRPAVSVLAAAAVTIALLAVPASTPSQAASFTLSDPNCSSFTWDSTSSTLTCNASGGGGGGAFSCSIAASVGSPTVSQAEVLTANCSNAAGTVTYTWSAAAGNAGGCPTGITQRASPNVADVPAPGGTTSLNCTYKLSANDSVTTVTPNKQLSYSTGGGGGGGGGGGPVSCTLPNGGQTRLIDAQWGSATTFNTSGFGPYDAVVIRFTTSGATTATGKGYLRGVEFQSPITPRTGALSSVPCDFNGGLAKVGGGRSAFANDSAPWLYFSLVATKSGMATLQPNTTYYFNMINVGCTSSCDMQMYLQKPSGS